MSSSINNLIDLPNKLPLRVVLIVPLMLLLTGAVGVVGYLSFRNGQRAVNQVVTELQDEILHQIKGKLGDYVQVAHDINRLNAIALAKGDINPDSAAGETVFWQQNQIFPTASFVYCGNEKGNLVGVGKMTDKVHLQTWVVNDSTNHIPYFYGLDDQGNRNREFDKDAEPFDARVRPWYKAAKEARQPTWSPIYLGFTTHWPAIATSIPVYDSSGRTLIGACGIDFLLPQEMGQFLKSLNIGKTGSAFIIERSGMLVSTSTAEPIVENTSDGSERLLANQSSNSTIRATADFLEQRFDGFGQIQVAQRLAFDIDGARQFVQVVPFQDRYGLDWLIVIVLPEADYLGQIQSNIRDTLLLCILALVAALILSVLMARWITRPLLSLNQSAQAIADGQWNQTVNIKRSDELGKLANSFNQMAHQLQTAFLELQTLNQNLAENETRLQAFLESLPISISILDATGHPYYANQRRLQMVGEAIDPTVSSDHLAEVYHLYRAGTNQLYPNDQLPIIQALSGKHTRVDDIEIHQNGQTIPIEVWGTPIFDAQGNVAYAIATFQDITERKQAEKLLADYNCTLEQQVAERTAALQRSEAKFRAIFENSQIGIFQVRISDGLILDANQRFANLYGFDSPEAMIGLERTRSYYVNSSERQQFLELLKRDKEVRSYEVQMRKRDGTVFWGQFSSYLNAANGYIEGVLADISDRKQAEEALQRSEAKFRAIFENSQVGIFRNRISDGLILDANQCFAELLGFDSPQEIIGLEHTIDYWVNPSDRQHAIEVMKRDGELRSHEAQLRKRDGTVFWGITSSYLNAADGYVEGVVADVSDRKQAEEALQRSEAKFRTIFENSQVGIYRTRTYDALILDANQRFANLLGFDSPEEIIGLEHSIGYFVNPSDRQYAIEVMKRDGEMRSFEVQMRKRDGTLFWGLCSSYLNATDDYIEGVVADISDRKRAEAALQISEERLRLALTASNQGLYDLDIKTGEIVVNPEYVLMLGYDPATYHVTKSKWIKSLHPDDRESVVAAYHACITGEIPNFQVEYRRRTQNGQWKWIFDVGKIVTWNDSGEPIRALGVITDIDHRKQAEAALQVSESKLRTLIEAIPDPLFVFSAEGRFLEIMVLEPELLWYPFEEMIGKTMHQLGREEADEFLGYIQQVLRTQQILTVEYGAFLNGREMWFSARIAPISHDQVIWLVRDITAQKQAEEASILEERNRMAREIHDTLAQSFTGILAQVGAAKQVLMDDVEATQAHLDLIKELARTGLTEARRSVVALRPQLLEEGSLQSALHRLVAQTRAAAMDTTLYYEIEGTVYSLPAEVENNLLRMGQEALTNAIRHANADEIRVQLAYDRDQVSLRVRDNGQGFGVGSMPSSEGFGLLGMSERAERIGAQLTIRSQPGQGTEIIVTVNP